MTGNEETVKLRTVTTASVRAPCLHPQADVLCLVTETKTMQYVKLLRIYTVSKKKETKMFFVMSLTKLGQL